MSICGLVLSKIYISGHGLVCETSTDGLKEVDRCESGNLSQCKNY